MTDLVLGGIYWWDLPRYLSEAEIDAIDERIENAFRASDELGVIEEAKKENLKYDRRPVVILTIRRNQVIVGKCTTKDYTDRGAVKIEPVDFVRQTTRTTTYFRPDCLGTDHVSYCQGALGVLRPLKFAECIKAAQGVLGTAS